MFVSVLSDKKQIARELVSVCNNPRGVVCMYRESLSGNSAICYEWLSWGGDILEVFYFSSFYHLIILQ